MTLMSAILERYNAPSGFSRTENLKGNQEPHLSKVALGKKKTKTYTLRKHIKHKGRSEGNPRREKRYQLGREWVCAVTIQLAAGELTGQGRGGEGRTMLT